MKVKFFVASLALGFAVLGAHGQVGLYVNPVVSRISNSVADTGPFAFLGAGRTSDIFGGVQFGAYYDWYHGDRLSAGVDVRDAIEHGNNATLNSFLVGPRVTHHFERWSPYAEVAVGAGQSKSPLSPVHLTKLEYDVFGGADFKLARHIDIRAIEVGYGSVTTISSETYNSSVSIPAARRFSASTGFVFRFP